MENTDQYEPPESGARDKAHMLARAGLSNIPIVGGAAVELFAELLAPPLEKRKQRWMENIAYALRKIEAEQEIVMEKLAEDESFITILV